MVDRSIRYKHRENFKFYIFKKNPKVYNVIEQHASILAVVLLINKAFLNSQWHLQQIVHRW